MEEIPKMAFKKFNVLHHLKGNPIALLHEELVLYYWLVILLKTKLRETIIE